MSKRVNLLTPLEKQRAEEQAYAAFLERMKLYNPPEEPTTTDLVSDNRRVMDWLVKAVGWLPLILAIIGLAAATVSMDKTSAAFEASVAHKNGLWGAWSYIVALAAVVMVDCALVVAEFALVRDMLRKGLHRHVWTVTGTARALGVRLGMRPPLDFHEMPDQSLHFYAQFLFALVISANVYAVTKTGHITSVHDLNFENGLLLFTGVAGALSLRFLGQQLSHIVYDMAAERREIDKRDMYEVWREDVTRIWAEEGGKYVSEAMHQRFVQKNHLDLDAPSPYLMITSGEEGEEGAAQAVPLAISQEPSRQPSQPTSPNRNGDGPEPP